MNAVWADLAVAVHSRIQWPRTASCQWLLETVAGFVTHGMRQNHSP
jgi:hypothetical protein